MKNHIKFFIAILALVLFTYSCSRQNEPPKDVKKEVTTSTKQSADTLESSQTTSKDKQVTKTEPKKESVKTKREKKRKSTETNPYKKTQDYKSYSKTQYRIGAICRDGTRSYATGRGACSHHGGVAYWLYK